MWVQSVKGSFYCLATHETFDTGRKKDHRTSCDVGCENDYNSLTIDRSIVAIMILHPSQKDIASLIRREVKQAY